MRLSSSQEFLGRVEQYSRISTCRGESYPRPEERDTNMNSVDLEAPPVMARIVRCPHCRIRVRPTNGECPSCRNQVPEEAFRITDANGNAAFYSDSMENRMEVGPQAAGDRL